LGEKAKAAKKIVQKLSLRPAKGKKYNRLVSESLAQIGSSQAKRGNHALAKKTFGEAKAFAIDEKDALERDLILREIAYREAEAGLFDDSHSTIECIKWDENKNWALNRLASQQAREGKYSDAKKTSRKINDAAILCPILSELAEVEIYDGKINCAVATILEARKKAMEIENKMVKQVALEILDDIEKGMHADLITIQKRLKL